jgi:hypothetical protein
MTKEKCMIADLAQQMDLVAPSGPSRTPHPLSDLIMPSERLALVQDGGRTGDIMREDADGNFWLVSRTNDLIVLMRESYFDDRQ